MDVDKFREDSEDNTDLVKEYVSRNEKPLAELREKTLNEIGIIKEGMQDFEKGMAIGISPTDKVLEQFTRGEITNLITKIFTRIRARGSDGALVPIAPLDLLLVGEYSPKHRWHYHGYIVVNNITILDKIKKKINKMIGRTVTEMINDTVNYTNYMFKQYECPEHGMFYDWNVHECIVRVHNIVR